MKKSILIIIMLVSASILRAQSWKVVSSPDLKQAASDIYFVSEDEGWMSADSGVVYHTTNGGLNWSLQNTNVVKNLKKIFFLDSNNGWIGTADGSILITKDGGKSWTESIFAGLVPNIKFTYFDAICFTSSTKGFIVAGKDKAIYLFMTTDGGMNWVKKDSLTGTVSQRWYDISFADANNGVIAGDKKTNIKYTTDGGTTWNSSPITDQMFGVIKSVRWLSSKDVVLMGEGNDFTGLPCPVYKSADGGKTWVKKATGSFDRVKDSYFKNSLEGICAGSNGFSKMFYMKTSDGGETWTPLMGNFSVGLQAVTGFNNVLYALGTDNHIFKSTDFGSTWSIFPMKAPSAIYAIQFKGGKGYALSRYSDVYKNEDGTGKSWNFASSAGVWEGYSMSFIDPSVGFVLKENRHIVKTTDGGKTWVSVLDAVDYNTKNKLGGIAFPDAQTGYAWMSLDDYAQYHVFKTADGGSTWNEILNIPGPSIIDGSIQFFDASTGIIAGPKGWIIRTTDGGTKWDTVQVSNAPSTLKASAFQEVCIAGQNAWAISEKAIYFSSDKGASWNYIDHGIKNIDTTFYTVSFRSDGTGYVSCYDGSILKTTDSGKSWQLDESLKGKYHFYSSAFDESGRIYFGTSNGLIVTLEDQLGVDEKEIASPKGFALEQNFPNPFNPVTSIRFTIPVGGMVSLTVYDILGREVSVLASGFYKAGSQTLSFDASRLSSGIYYYQLKAGAFTQTRKMTVLK
ncbi:MAG: T9SS type A sorting domain-containing protein [Ignavibacteria bacterium]|jgi:photosystem II stability/assembly factor-like uncharacterized protein|nr:T9SS type A sorting domain-containing protein [Ignavibacteria bacterium]MCU7503556.1 T9SS type A sorting domain-containing protein [Ignavibacteria bacterium]MCU7516790.1 T9SS type A sorting domain-containing protein [Ignavibacteria bacterium]